MKTIGAAFQVDDKTAQALGLNTVPGLDRYIRKYINGRDFAGTARGIYIVDFFGLDADEVRKRYPAAYQHLLERAKPERDQNRNDIFRERWWVIGHPRQQFRKATEGLHRYIATIETAKHRFFAFVPAELTPDSTLVTFASSNAVHLGCLCSSIHAVWVTGNAGSMGVYIGNIRYNKSICFEPFPFPEFEDIDAKVSAASRRITGLAEQLDAHRKRQQAAHPDITLTGMYNVIEKLRSGETLTAKERIINEYGLVSVLRQLHDELDATVLDAYGWSDLLPLLRIAHNTNALSEHPLPPSAPSPAGGGRDVAMSREEAGRAFDEAILERLVALNAERAAEEAHGLVRWLRPEFQNPSAQTTPQQVEMDTGTDVESAGTESMAVAKPLPWPRDAVDQVRAVVDVFASSSQPLSLDDIAARFTARGAWKKRLPPLLEMLVALGRAREAQGRYAIEK